MQKFVRHTPFIAEQLNIAPSKVFPAGKGFKNRPKIDDIQRCSINNRIDNVLCTIREINNEVGYNLFDNEGWREWGVAELLRKSGYASFTLMNSRVGQDAECLCHDLRRIEIKTSKIATKSLRASNGFAEFCRQNTKQGLDSATNGYDGIVLALFHAFVLNPLLVVFVNTANGVEKFRSLVAAKQEEFSKTAAEQGSTMVSGRDSIRITFRNVYENLDAQEYEIYYNGARIDDISSFLKQLYSKQGLEIVK